MTVLDRFDVLGPGQNQRRLVDLTPELGIELASSLAESEVAYELKIPLEKTWSRTYAVGATPGRTIGLGIATPEEPVSRGQSPRLVGDSGFIGGNPLVRRRLRELSRRRRPPQAARDLDDAVISNGEVKRRSFHLPLIIC